MDEENIGSLQRVLWLKNNRYKEMFLSTKTKFIPLTGY